MEEKKLSGQESLELIQGMIQVARDEHYETGYGWLIWGWLLFLASVSSIVLSYLHRGEYISWCWYGILVIGAIVYTFGHVLRKRKEGVQTYIQKLLSRIEAGFFISLFSIIIGEVLLKRGVYAFGYYYILYAFWMFIFGSAIRFRPLITGAVINWVAAIGIFIVEPFRYDMMISAIAVFFGYLIPGYILRREYRKKMKL